MSGTPARTPRRTPQQRLKRVPWTDDEVAAALEGYAFFKRTGPSRQVWKDIKTRHKARLAGRTTTDIKDKIRNLQLGDKLRDFETCVAAAAPTQATTTDMAQYLFTDPRYPSRFTRAESHEGAARQFQRFQIFPIVVAGCSRPVERVRAYALHFSISSSIITLYTC
jgi:hypothetical protein